MLRAAFLDWWETFRVQDQTKQIWWSQPTGHGDPEQRLPVREESHMWGRTSTSSGTPAKPACVSRGCPARTSFSFKLITLFGAEWQLSLEKRRRMGPLHGCHPLQWEGNTSTHRYRRGLSASLLWQWGQLDLDFRTTLAWLPMCWVAFHCPQDFLLSPFWATVGSFNCIPQHSSLFWWKSTIFVWWAKPPS